MIDVRIRKIRVKLIKKRKSLESKIAFPAASKCQAKLKVLKRPAKTLELEMYTEKLWALFIMARTTADNKKLII